jgi:hypothetical protein
MLFRIEVLALIFIYIYIQKKRMPRFLGGSSARAPLTDPTEYPSLNEIDLNEIGNNGTTYYTENVWLSDYNSFNRSVNASETVSGSPDHISGWDCAEIRVSNETLLSTLQYKLSVDGGKTYPFSVPVTLTNGFGSFPLMGQFGCLTFTTSSTWVTGTRIQIALFYRRSAMGNSGAALLGASGSHPNDLIPASTNAINVKVVNSWEDDYITGKIGSRRTGACAGYSDDIGTAFMSITNISSGFLPYPAAAGSTGNQIASSSANDSAGGTGIALYIMVFMKIDYSLTVEFVSLNGITPVNLTTSPIYRFVIGFPLVAGSTYNYLTTVGANRGVIYVGKGAFSTATGFATNYMVNRIDDGVIVTPTYTVPLGSRALLYELKYVADASKPVVYRTYGREAPNVPWSLQIEDIATQTIQPRRSLIGGWRMPGAEWTVVAKRAGGTNVTANVIVTVIEVDEAIYRTYIP